MESLHGASVQHDVAACGLLAWKRPPLWAGTLITLFPKQVASGGGGRELCHPEQMPDLLKSNCFVIIACSAE